MKKTICFLFILMPIILLAQQSINIIPVPVYLKANAGNFIIDNYSNLKYDAANADLKSAATFFLAAIKNISGYQLAQNSKSNKSIQFVLKPTAEVGDEGYLLTVTPTNILIQANKHAGIVYAIQTILQTLPAIRTNAALQVPCMEVKDYPRFKWRGMHLDVCRHFFGPGLVKEYIDLMAAYKMNTFHWHLVDDQGWRIEIKKYPLLTQVGAWRADFTGIPWRARPQATAADKADYGGYYTQAQVKDIIKYAEERNVTIVPEIEMPGHVASAIAAYPQLSCTQQFQYPLTGGDYNNISSNYCAGNDSVFLFLENVLTEIIQLFPSKYIHVGGDEVDKSSWKKCPRCQERMKAEGLKNEDELQSYFMKRIEKFIVSKHRKMIGWDEILEGGLAPEATVMSWRGEAGGIQAAKMGHDVVMTPGFPLYFDHYQAGPQGEPEAFGGMNTLKNVYDYEPIPKELDETESKYVLGAQANIWTEMITTAEHVEYMLLPRMLALAEVVWSPKDSRSWLSFNQRLQPSFKAFGQKGYHYSKGDFTVNIKPIIQNGQLAVSLSTEAINSSIYYTTDDTEPTNLSTKYSDPILINSSITLKAVTYVNGVLMSTVPSVQVFTLHKAVGKNIVYTNANSNSYPADGPGTLIDGIRGGTDHSKYWHGFSGKDLIASIDLNSVQTIDKISIGCLQNYRSWIFFPQWVKVEVSTDGTHYTEVKTITNTIPATDQTINKKDFTANFAALQARYVRVTAKVLDAAPKGHPGEGKPVWLFADEIVVE